MANIEGYDVRKYQDLSYRGYKINLYTQRPESYILTGNEAIKNVIKMYLMSNSGDYGRSNILKGGPLVGIIGKPLTDATEAALETLIRAAIDSYTNIILTDLVINKDTPNKRWIITLSFIDEENKFMDTINIAITV